MTGTGGGAGGLGGAFGGTDAVFVSSAICLRAAGCLSVVAWMGLAGEKRRTLLQRSEKLRVLVRLRRRSSGVDDDKAVCLSI